MTAVPAVPSTFVVGKARASDQELMRLVSSFLLAPPICQARCDTQQTLTTSVAAVVNFTVEDVDTTDMHSTTTNPSRFTATYAGWYEVAGQVTFAANAAGRRRTYLQVNGTPVPSSGVYLAAGVAEQISVPRQSMLVFLNVGDYLEMVAWQNSGGNLAIHVTSTTTDGNSIITLKRVSN